MASSIELERLATVQLVPPTPFSSDGRRLVPEVLEHHVRDMATAGIRVFLPAAGTGEFHSLSIDEVVECVKVTRAAVSAECVVIAPIGFGLAHATEIGRRAADAGADGLLLMPPVHPYLCDEGFRDYVAALATALPLPLLAYRRGPVPSDALLIELAKAGRLRGVKYAVNDVDALSRFVASAPTELGVYCGTAERFAPFFAMAGATGFTSGAANICPRLSLQLHSLLAARRFDDAMQLLRVIRPIEDFRARDGDSFNISAVKFAVSLRGHEFGPARPPQRRMSAEQQQELRSVVKPLLAAEQQVAQADDLNS